MISNHFEPTFVSLRYILGGDRPSQTARLTVSPDPIQGRRLEIQQTKGKTITMDDVVELFHIYLLLYLLFPVQRYENFS